MKNTFTSQLEIYIKNAHFYGSVYAIIETFNKLVENIWKKLFAAHIIYWKIRSSQENVCRVYERRKLSKTVFKHSPINLTYLKNSKIQIIFNSLLIKVK